MKNSIIRTLSTSLFIIALAASPVLTGCADSLVGGQDGHNVIGQDGHNVDGQDGHNVDGQDGHNVDGQDGHN